MSHPNSLVHFEIHASDPETSIAFYRAVFGWDIKKWDSPHMEYWVVMTCPKDAPNAVNGGLIRRKGPAPKDEGGVNGYVCTMVVEDFEATWAKALAAGATVALPKFSIAGMAWQGYLKDPDGNIFGIHQMDANAK